MLKFSNVKLIMGTENLTKKKKLLINNRNRKNLTGQSCYWKWCPNCCES
jgi:hypothetical protein